MSALVTAAAPVSPSRRLLRRLGLRSFDLLSRIAAGVLVLLVLLTLLQELTGFAGDPNTIVGPRLAGPSGQWWLGTDSLGRSLLPRLLEGIGTTLLLSAVAVLCTVAVSTALGVLAGYRGGWLEEVILRVGDMLYAFPAIVLAILVTAVVGPGELAAVASIVLVTLPLMTRMVGSAARSVTRRDFVVSAKVSGVRPWTIMTRHILANVAGVVVVQATYALSVGILVEGGLSFLGFGVQLPNASLGLLVQDGSLYMVIAPWLVIAPAVVLVLAIVSINLLGDGLRDRFETADTEAGL